eukprot:364484-Chlamydomonas_euryale.AAC.5
MHSRSAHGFLLRACSGQSGVPKTFWQLVAANSNGSITDLEKRALMKLSNVPRTTKHWYREEMHNVLSSVLGVVAGKDLGDTVDKGVLEGTGPPCAAATATTTPGAAAAATATTTPGSAAPIMRTPAAVGGHPGAPASDGVTRRTPAAAAAAIAPALATGNAPEAARRQGTQQGQKRRSQSPASEMQELSSNAVDYMKRRKEANGATADATTANALCGYEDGQGRGTHAKELLIIIGEIFKGMTSAFIQAMSSTSPPGPTVSSAAATLAKENEEFKQVLLMAKNIKECVTLGLYTQAEGDVELAALRDQLLHMDD